MHTFYLDKPERKIPLVRPRHRCKDNIKIEHKEVGLGDVNWISIAKDRDQC
jgi:hypothetical protein